MNERSSLTQRDQVNSEAQLLARELFNLYQDLVKNLFTFDDTEFQSQILSVIFVTNRENEFTRTKLNFFDESVRCAYLLNFSILHTLSTIEHFQKVKIGDSSLFERFFIIEKLRVCCFGGGPGIELVAICKFVNDFLNKNCEENKPVFLKLYFTIIDICKDWEDWATAIIKKLRKCCEFCDKDRIEVRLRFVHADLTKRWNEDVKKAVVKSDILTMVRFLSMMSISEEDYETKKDLHMISKIVQQMKLDSWIFFLDYAGGGFYKKISEKLQRYQYLEKCHSSLHQHHSVEEIIESQEVPTSICFEDRMMCKQHSTVLSSGTWVKRVPNVRSVKKKHPKLTPKVTKPVQSAQSILEEHLRKFQDLDDD